MDIKNILAKQKEYFLSSNTQNIDLRIEYIKLLKNEIIKHEDEIKEALFIELGKNSGESYMTEIGIVLNEISYFIKNIKKYTKTRKVKSSFIAFPSKAYIDYHPYGNTLIVSPWNYPFQLSLNPLIGSIMAGNTVILKPSSDETPLTTSVIKKILSNVFPQELVYVYDEPLAKIDELINLKFDYIFFTGSTKIGKIYYEKASKNLTPVTLELGGKSPVIIDDNINVKLAAKRIAFGKLINAGQTCIAPDYVLIKESMINEFIAYYKEAVVSFYGVNPSDNINYPKIINEKHYNRLKSLIEGERVEIIGDNNDTKLAPMIIAGATFNSKSMQEEIFGPILPIVTYNNIDILVKELVKLPSPLSMYIFSNDKQFINTITSRINFGGLTINDTLMHFNVHNLGFGGVGESGIGKYHGKYSFLTFSHQRSILKRKNYLDLNLRYQPLTSSKEKMIKKVLK